MCEKTDVFFYCKNRKRKIKKPKGFVHFMLKEIIDTSQEINKNLNAYTQYKDYSYKFSNIIKNGAKVQIFASNDMVCVAIMLKDILEKKYQIKTKISKLEKKCGTVYDVNDVCIFLNNKKRFSKLIKLANKLKCKKVLITSESPKNKDKGFDLVAPVFREREKIGKLTKSYSVFYSVFLLLINENNFSKIKKACEVIEDLDIMPIVNFAKEISECKEVCFWCEDKFEKIINYYFSNINFNICKNANMTKDEFLNKKHIFVVSDNDLFNVFADSSFCLNNLNKSYLVFGGEKVGEIIKNEELYISTIGCGKAIDLVFIFYLQLIAFYVNLFLGNNPDLL